MIRRLGRPALVVGGLAVGLLLAEVALRALELPGFDACTATADYAVPDPVLGFRGDSSRPVVGVTPNALGLRGPLPHQPKPADETRILFLGDSTCWGLGVELDETFAARATARVDAALPNGDARFVLGAFPGYSSYHSAVLLDRLMPLAPDLVVFYVGARNDGDRARYYADADIPARQARVSAAWHQLHVLRAFEAGYDFAWGSLLRKLRPAPQQARVPLDAFRANLQRMAGRLREAGVPGVVVLPPISPAFEREEPAVRDYRRVLEAVAAEYALPVVFVDPGNVDEADAPFFFDDHFHLAPAGHAATAAALHAVLVRERLVPHGP